MRSAAVMMINTRRSHGLCRKAESSLTEKIMFETPDFFSLSEDREYVIPSHPPHILKKIVGSSHGWLITTDKVSTVQLINPITGVQIDLPSIPTMHNWNLEARKAVLSSDPSRCGDYKVVFVFFCLHELKNFLFFVSAGDEKWTMIPERLYYYANIAFHDGKLYAVSKSKENKKLIVGAYDLSVLNSIPTRVRVADLPYIKNFTFSMCFFCTSSDDLLIVRATIEKVSEHHLKKIKVWKVDTNNGAIIPMNNLGKYALFIGLTSSHCLDTSSLPDLKSNSIYILNYLGESVVYNMEDKSFTSLNLPLLSSPMRPVLVWFTPSCAF
ncbi:F-box protein At2g05970-like [Zingiber officinale]|uniref:F-box protein At2g05970-like n=1 Tax=Zingiber officinale TaxID=94328 RepID=UPI001C4D6E7F|nr:F-box protein At2g05970-like [Zingiber officinale]